MKVLAVLYKGGKWAEQEPRLLGTIENQLGIRQWLQDQGHTYVVTDDKDNANSTFDKELVDADVIITTPFHPGYITAERIAKAKNLKLCITAGVGSDHVDLNAANQRKISVLEVTGSNVVSVAEHVVMTILNLVRNYTPAHEQIMAGGWDVAEIARNAYDLEGKVVGTVGAGRIGYRVLQRLMGFDCKELLYFDYQDIPAEAAAKIKARRVEKLEDMLAQCDVVTINCPLHEGTKGLFNKELIAKMKKGAWLVNTARGAIVDAQAVKEAIDSRQLNGYGGDVWSYQPAPLDHPFRAIAKDHTAMVAHYSGTTLDAQKRYAEGTKLILDQFLNKNSQFEPKTNIIVINGDYGTKAYGQR